MGLVNQNVVTERMLDYVDTKRGNVSGTDHTHPRGGSQSKT